MSATIDATTLRPGDRIEGQPYGDSVPVTILRARESAPPDFFGRIDQFRYWSRREDNGTEGWMTFGPGGVAHKVQA